MRKGLTTIDMLLALTMLMFLFVWLQSYSSLNLGGSSTWGAVIQSKGAALSAGSQMNAFYAMDPGEYDWAVIPNASVKLFANSTQTLLFKNRFEVFATVRAIVGTTSYDAKYPVFSSLSYDPLSGKVVKP